MKHATSIIAGVAALIFVSMSIVIPAEARRGFSGGGHHVSRNVGRHYAGNVGRYAGRNVGHYAGGYYAGRNVGRYARNYDYGYRGRYYRGPGHWVNGVWVATGVAAGAAAVRNSCNYYYRRWQATGSSYWRNLYAECTG